MFVPYKKTSDDYRCWVYKFEKKIDSLQKKNLKKKLSIFCEKWESHNRPIWASFKIVSDYYVILFADDRSNNISGCAIDEQRQIINTIGQEMKLNIGTYIETGIFFNNKLFFLSQKEIKNNIENDKINSHSKIINITVKNKKEFEEKWILPINKSWMKNLLIITITLFIFQSCITTKSALKNFNNAEFNSAAEKYEQIVKENDPKTNFLLAESYRKSNQIKKATNYYYNAIKNGYKDEIANYYLALSLKANNKISEAKSIIENYIKKGNNEKYIEFAKQELNNLKKLNDFPDSGFYEIKNLKAINSELIEYSPSYSNGKLFFVSNRDTEKKYKGTGTPFTDIYQVKTKGAIVELKTLKIMPNNINEEEINEGSITFSKDGLYMIFAKGNSGKSSGRNNVDLYYSRFRSNKWQNPRLLNINNSKSWDSTPFLTKDGNTLYFSSNRTKGYGGTDIYKANLNRRGRWVNIQNLGSEINTPGNEMFPHISDDGKLHFSSDYHLGFGGLDILIATRKGGKITVENPGKPLNSEGDDFGIYFFSQTKGFFTSNRVGGKGDDDIYTFINNDPDLKIVNYSLSGTTLTPKNETSYITLDNSTVKLTDKNNSIIEETFTDDNGLFEFIVYPEEEYYLVGEKENYFNTRVEFNTLGKSLDKSKLKDFITNVKFEKNLVLDKIILNKSIVLKNIYYDLDKSNIRDDAAIELNKLVRILEDNPKISIELSSHTDNRADVEYNFNLSQRRAEAAVNYIISKGIEKERLIAKGYGESQLIIEDAATEEEHQINRRTEFKVIKYSETEDGKNEERFFNENNNIN